MARFARADPAKKCRQVTTSARSNEKLGSDGPLRSPAQAGHFTRTKGSEVHPRTANERPRKGRGAKLRQGERAWSSRSSIVHCARRGVSPADLIPSLNAIGSPRKTPQAGIGWNIDASQQDVTSHPTPNSGATMAMKRIIRTQESRWSLQKIDRRSPRSARRRNGTRRRNLDALENCWTIG